MGGEWPVTTLGDICSHSAFGPRFSSKEYSDTGNIACLRTKDISADGRIEFSTMPLADLDEKSFSNHYLQREDLVITRTGRVGTTAVFTEFDCPVVPGAFLIRFRLDRRLADPWFYRYFFNSDAGQSLIQTVATGSVQQNLNITNLHTLSIPLPPLVEQREIARILGTLDDKIELDRQMNATLEAMAQALFKSWFVDFDPVIDNALAAGNPIPEPLHARAEARAALGDKRKPLPEAIQKQFPNSFVFSEEMGWVPEGWEARTIGQVLELAYGKSLPSTKRVDGFVPVYGSGGLSGWHNEKLVDGPGIIVGRKGTVGSLYWVEEDFFPIDTVFYVVNKTSAPLFWLFQSLALIDIESMGADSAVPGVNRNAVYARYITLPPRSVFECYVDHISTFNSKRRGLSEEAEVLSKLRDTLLPKLLSGELRIPDAEKLAADAV